MHLPLPLLLSLAPLAHAWGMLGHRAAAVLSTRYLLPETSIFVKSLLPGRQTIITASTWPDYYAHTAEGRYSAPWHWIDAIDDPPSKCGVVYNRDCNGEEGCIVSAIANMTTRVTSPTLPFSERSMALKFLIHFIADIHQPLHTENLLRGGNQIPVLWNSRATNLHHVWDSAIPEKHIGGNSIRHAVSWADALYNAIEAGTYLEKQRGDWSRCFDLSKTEECVIGWAEDANAFMCSYILPRTYPGSGLNNQELNGTYYDGAVEIVNALVAASGWRLAGWLNLIVTGRTGLEVAGEPQGGIIQSLKQWMDSFRGGEL